MERVCSLHIRGVPWVELLQNEDYKCTYELIPHSLPASCFNSLVKTFESGSCLETHIKASIKRHYIITPLDPAQVIQRQAGASPQIPGRILLPWLWWHQVNLVFVLLSCFLLAPALWHETKPRASPSAPPCT